VIKVGRDPGYKVTKACLVFKVGKVTRVGKVLATQVCKDLRGTIQAHRVPREFKGQVYKVGREITVYRAFKVILVREYRVTKGM
jgi:hypothetical protein